MLQFKRSKGIILQFNQSKGIILQFNQSKGIILQTPIKIDQPRFTYTHRTTYPPNMIEPRNAANQRKPTDLTTTTETERVT